MKTIKYMGTEITIQSDGKPFIREASGAIRFFATIKEAKEQIKADKDGGF